MAMQLQIIRSDKTDSGFQMARTDLRGDSIALDPKRIHDKEKTELTEWLLRGEFVFDGVWYCAELLDSNRPEDKPMEAAWTWLTSFMVEHNLIKE